MSKGSAKFFSLVFSFPALTVTIELQYEFEEGLHLKLQSPLLFSALYAKSR